MRGPRRAPESLRFDRVAGEYDATRGGLQRGAAFADAVREVLFPPHPAASGPVLEVAVGTGAVAARLAAAPHARAGTPHAAPGALGLQVIGVDLSLPMLAIARDRLGGRVVAGDAHALPIRDASVAAAYSVWLFHLVGDPARVFVEVARVLRPGGRYVVVPAKPAVLSDDDVSRTLWPRLDALRDRSDSRDRLLAFGDAAGFALVAEARLKRAGRLSPHVAADRVEQRVYSALWELTEVERRQVVEPIVHDLRRLPDPQRERVTRDEYAVLAFATPRR